VVLTAYELSLLVLLISTATVVCLLTAVAITRIRANREAVADAVPETLMRMTFA
jgi:hypothetical protein